MNAYATAAGVILILISVGGFSGIIPLALVNSTTLTPSVNCDSSDNCTVSVSVTNVNATNPLQVWVTLKSPANYGGSTYTIWTSSIPANIPQGQSQGVTLSIPGSVLLANAPNVGGYVLGASTTFDVQVFALDTYGRVVSESASTQFSANPELILLPDPGTGSVSATPAGTQVTCPSFVQTASPGSFCATYPEGTTVTLNSPSGIGFIYKCVWLAYGNQCPAQEGQQVLSGGKVTMTRSFSLMAAPLNQLPVPQAFTLSADIANAGGLWSPNGDTTIYAPGAGTPSSVTFTYQPIQNTTYIKQTLTGWTLLANCPGPSTKTIKSGTNSSLTVSWALVSLYVSQGCLTGNLKATAKVTYSISLVISSLTGITTIPTGTQYYQNKSGGVQQKVTETTQSGYCFAGWIYDGKSMGNDSSITVTVTGTDALLANGYAKSTGICSKSNAPPPPVPPPIVGQRFSYVSLAFLLGGVVLVGYGVRSKSDAEA